MSHTDAASLPLLGRALSARTVSGLEALDAPGAYQKGPAEAPEHLLRREYGTDAHFVPYYPSEDPQGLTYNGDDYPRINKSCLPSLHAAGGDLLCQYLVYDVDNPLHAPHASASAAHEGLSRLWNGTPAPAFAYTSRNGWRVGYLLPTPVSVSTLEPLHARFLPSVQQTAGPVAHVDPTCKDWTRVYRLPKVQRDVVPAPLESHHLWFALRLRDPGEVVPLDLASIPAGAARPARPAPPAPPAGLRRPALELDDEPPGHAECGELLDALAHGGSAHALQVELRQRTRHRVCDPFLWRDQEIAPPLGPGRSTAIHRIAGDACCWFIRTPGGSPELLYAILWQQVASWANDSIPNGDASWLDHLWAAITKYWQREHQQLPEPDAPASLNQLLPPHLQEQHTLLGRMTTGVLRWPASPIAGLEPALQHAWILRHAVAVVGGSREEYYLLRPDGYYEVGRVSSSALIPAIRDLGLDELLALEVPTGTGVRQKTAAEIVRDYGTRVTGRTMRVGIQGPTGVPGAVWRATTHGAELEYSTFARRAIAPAHDAEVEAWLRELAGEQYDDLCRWIAYALAFEEGPICALSLRGSPGAGKKLFARGLSETIDPPGRFATGHDLGLRRYGLLHSPFMVIDEGIPDAIPLSDRADVFRSLIAGERVRVQELYSAPADVCNPVRCVFTTNNMDVVAGLAGGRDLSSDDQEALARRLLFIEIPDGCAGYLEARGGVLHTRGWVDGDGGEPGDARIARHFLYLHAQRHRWPTGARFLVEGAADPRVKHALLMATPTAATLIEAIVDLVERGGSPGTQHQVLVEEGRIYVTSQSVVDQARSLAARSRGIRPPSTKAVSAALRSFCVPGGFQALRRSNLHYHALDLNLLAQEAENMGLRCDRLRGILSNEIKDVPRNVGTILKLVKEGS